MQKMTTQTWNQYAKNESNLMDRVEQITTQIVPQRIRADGLGVGCKVLRYVDVE